MVNAHLIDIIIKVDSGFFERLRDSKYYLEDKENKTPFVLFADSEYTDKDYYNDTEIHKQIK